MRQLAMVASLGGRPCRRTEQSPAAQRARPGGRQAARRLAVALPLCSSFDRQLNVRVFHTPTIY